MARTKRLAAAAAAALLFGGAGAAVAQGESDEQTTQQRLQQQQQPQMEPRGGHAMTGRGMGPGMMGQMPHMQGQMGPGQMGHGMMMGQAMGPGMMGQHPMAGMHRMMMEHMAEHMGEGAHHEGMLGPHFGMRVVPVMHLSVDDVRRYLERQLARQGFDRLQAGTVEEVDDDTITAEIVTRDDSLVQRLEVDRHTGLISRGG